MSDARNFDIIDSKALLTFLLRRDGLRVDADGPSACTFTFERLIELAETERAKTSPPPPSDDEGQVIE